MNKGYKTAYIPTTLSKDELKENLGGDGLVFSTVMKYFESNPRKTVCKFKSHRIMVRKSNREGFYTLSSL